MPTPRFVAIVRAITAALVMATIISTLPAATTASTRPAMATRTTSLTRLSEWRILAHINALRADYGLAPLRMARGVRRVAQARSKSMKDLNYFGHYSPRGRTAGDVMNARGVRYHSWNENIGWVTWLGAETTSSAVVDAWRRSRGHRENLLSRTWNYVGIGVVRDGLASYMTVVFVNQSDHTAPVAGMTGSRHVLSVATAAAGGTKAVTVQWWGHDRILQQRTSGLRSFKVQMRKAGGHWQTVRRATTARQLTMQLHQGTYQFRVRAKDRKGNVGRWGRPLVVDVN
jgi:uncharacterized protein YkwD